MGAGKRIQVRKGTAAFRTRWQTGFEAGQGPGVDRATGGRRVDEAINVWGPESQ